MSKVHLEPNVLMNTVRVYIYDREANGSINLWVYDGDETWHMESISEGEQLPETPTLTLRREHLESLVAQAGDFLPPSGAQSRHLDDALKVRDRILTLLEAKLP